MRLPDMTVIGIAIGTNIIRTSITAVSLFLSMVSGGASTHGITIPITAMVTGITRMTTHMITLTTIAGILTMEPTTLLPKRMATTMAMRLQASIATELSVEYNRSSPALGIITARSTEFSVMKAKPLSPNTNRIKA